MGFLLKSWKAFFEQWSTNLCKIYAFFRCVGVLVVLVVGFLSCYFLLWRHASLIVFEQLFVIAILLLIFYQCRWMFVFPGRLYLSYYVFRDIIYIRLKLKLIKYCRKKLIISNSYTVILIQLNKNYLNQVFLIWMHK